MTIVQAFILGIIQGLTEFLPISSSAHLVLIPKLLGWPASTFSLAFDTSLHIGTALAILIYFYKDFLKLNRKMLSYLAVGSLPVMLVGFLFDDLFETIFRGVFWMVIFLLVGSIVLWIAEVIIKKRSAVSSLNFKNALLMGLAQPLALFPGISRSGITISAGVFSGLSREEAAKFSFFLSMPAVGAAAGFKLLTTFKDIQAIGYMPWITGILVSFISGLLTIKFLLTFLKTRSLGIFIVYRVVLAILVLSLFFLHF